MWSGDKLNNQDIQKERFEVLIDAFNDEVVFT